jgi:lysozyme
MEASMNPHIEAQLIRDESERLKVYDDATGMPIGKGAVVQGYPTIGVGRNLVGLGLTKAESRYLLANDIARVTEECRRLYPWFDALDDVRQSVILNMRFNMGPKLDQFVNTLAAVARYDFGEAAERMEQSLWHKQVGQRAVRLERMMRTGVAE